MTSSPRTNPPGGIGETTTGALVSSARAERMAKVREQMERSGCDALLLSLGADLPWLTGYEAMPLERPTVLVITRGGPATLVVPFLEAPRVMRHDELFSLRPWKETEDPVALVADLAGNPGRVAVSDRAWAGLLIDLQAALGKATFAKASTITGPLRAVKDQAEIAALIGAGRAADRVATALLEGKIALIGRSEREVSNEIGERLIAEGHSRVNFAIVGSGPNSASPHHDAGERTIGENEPVVCDFGGVYHLGDEVGYCSDITRTVFTGDPPAEFEELYDVLEHAQASAVAAVAPGLSCEEIDRVGRSVIDGAGYGECFIHRIGHGIGIEAHEEPYLVAGNATPVVAGHAFSIEPGIYLPERLGARLEDIVVVDEYGAVSCNVVDHSLAVVVA